MQTPAYHTLDLEEHERDLQEYIASVTANATNQVTLASMVEALDNNGKDPALLDAATHLSPEEYKTFKARYSKHPVRHGQAGRKRRFS